MYSPVHLFYLQMQGLINKIANEGWCRLYQMCEHRQFSIESTALDGRCGMLEGELLLLRGPRRTLGPKIL